MNRSALMAALAGTLAVTVWAAAEQQLDYGDTLSLPAGKIVTFISAEFDLGGHSGTIYADMAMQGVSPGITNIPATPLFRLVPTVKAAGSSGNEGDPTNTPFAVSGPMDFRLVVYDLGTLFFNDPLTNTFIRYTVRDAATAARACPPRAAAANATARIETSRDLREWHTTQDGVFSFRDLQFFRTRGCGVSMEPVAGSSD